MRRQTLHTDTKLYFSVAEAHVREQRAGDRGLHRKAQQPTQFVHYNRSTTAPQFHVNRQRQQSNNYQAVGGRPPRYAPAPLLSPWAPKRLRRRADDNVAAISHGQHVPKPTAISESRVTWATSVPNLVFLGLSVLDLCPMYATDRRQTKASLKGCTLGVLGAI